MAYRHILAATDGSEYSRAAIEHAIKLAKSTRTKLTALYVASLNEKRVQAKVWLKEALLKEGQEVLAEVEKLAGEEGVQIETKIVEGIPSEKIVEVARNEKADLIVMGTRGRTGIKKILLGSVAERVIGAASCPVLVVGKK